MMLGTQLFYAFFYSTRDDVTHIPQIILYLLDHVKVFSENRFVFIYIIKYKTISNQGLLDIKVSLFDFGYNRYRRIILICKEKNLMFKTISIDAIAIHHKMTKTWQCHNRERCSYYSRERCK